MRRFARHLFTLCSLASALLLVIVLAVWVRSWFRVDGLIYQPRLDDPLHSFQVGWGRGTMGVGMYAAQPTATSRWFWFSSAPGRAGVVPPDPDAFEFLGFRRVRRVDYV